MDAFKIRYSAPVWRLPMGDYRILFDVEGREIIIRRIKHRREAYD